MLSPSPRVLATNSSPTLLAEEESGAGEAAIEAQRLQSNPMPPQESMQQPPIAGKGKGGGSKPPTKGTPTSIAEGVVAPEPPQGEF